jgi:hypothetical protein
MNFLTLSVLFCFLRSLTLEKAAQAFDIAAQVTERAQRKHTNRYVVTLFPHQRSVAVVC